MKGLVHIIADYSPGDLAFAEMVSALTKQLPEKFLLWGTSVASFDTLALGFLVAQLGLQDESLRPDETIIYANCAPRRDLSQARKNNEGEGILFGILSNKVPILVVNSGYSLSFVREELSELWSVNAERGGSQFRSRDIFPPLVGQVAKGRFDFRGNQLDPKQVIPQAPEGVVGYIDSFGNIKTTYRQGDAALREYREGENLQITIHGVTRPAVYSSGNFNVDDGETAFGPGSSGRERRFYEIFRRGESISSAFKSPPVGSPIQLSRRNGN